MCVVPVQGVVIVLFIVLAGGMYTPTLVNVVLGDKPDNFVAITFPTKLYVWFPVYPLSIYETAFALGIKKGIISKAGMIKNTRFFLMSI